MFSFCFFPDARRIFADARSAMMHLILRSKECDCVLLPGTVQRTGSRRWRLRRWAPPLPAAERWRRGRPGDPGRPAAAEPVPTWSSPLGDTVRRFTYPNISKKTLFIPIDPKKQRGSFTEPGLGLIILNIRSSQILFLATLGRYSNTHVATSDIIHNLV